MKSKSLNNEYIYKYIRSNILYFLISCSGAIVFTSFLYMLLDVLYRKSKYQLVIDVVDILKKIKNYYLGDAIYVILILIMSVIFYIIITYKKYKKVAILVNSIDRMAKGNLNQRIEIDSDDEIGKISRNINTIVNKLNEITMEERKAQQTKTDLITNVSHDLRTPLTSIIGYLNLIEEDKYRDEVELRYYINIAYEKAQNLNMLITDLFELTKLQNNTFSIQKVDINLVELIIQIVSQFEYQISEENMKVRMNFSSEVLLVNVDPRKLVRAFENLITNAMKYGGDGYYIDIIITKCDNMAVVQVINYGELIPLVDLPYIFDRFYRVEKSRNRYEGGSGLGLAITKNIIEIHGGRITVTSDNNETIFEVRIPLVVEKEKKEIPK